MTIYSKYKGKYVFNKDQSNYFTIFALVNILTKKYSFFEEHGLNHKLDSLIIIILNNKNMFQSTYYPYTFNMKTFMIPLL